MSEKESDFLKNLKMTLTIALGSSLVVLTGIILTFYFTTNFKLGDLDDRVESVESNSIERIEYEGHISTEHEKDVRIFETLGEIKVDLKDIQSKL